MKSLLSVWWVPLVCVFSDSAMAEPSAGIIDATLTASEKGYLRIVLENKTSKPLRLLDAREGSAMCAAIWTVEIRLADGRKLASAMFYQPGDPPYRITIEPGKSYERLIQPGAYVQHPESYRGHATVVVHYEVTGPFKNWEGLEPKGLAFSTQPLEMDLSHLF